MTASIKMHADFIVITVNVALGELDLNYQGQTFETLYLENGES